MLPYVAWRDAGRAAFSFPGVLVDYVLFNDRDGLGIKMDAAFGGQATPCVVSEGQNHFIAHMLVS